MEEKRQNNKISFYGYNDGKAIAIYNCIMLFIPTIISIIVSIIFTLFSFVLHNFYLLVVWILPAILCLTYILCIFTTKYNDKVFLEGSKKKHSFIMDSESLIRDGKPIKKDGLKVYTFKNFVFLITKKAYYRIPNEDFLEISREDFLRFIKNKN